MLSMAKGRLVREHLTDEKLREFLVLKGMTTKQLAGYYGVGLGVISKIMKERSFNLLQERDEYLKSRVNRRA